jgi:GNAT superfamily N-acetyltransferase
MIIQKYEDWMRPQVVALFDLEYQTGIDSFDTLFGSFYEHPYQREQCIRLVALDGERVAGFQSFFYWPVVHHGKTLRSYQSGNSLVHPDYRGKGIFGKLLRYIHQPESGFEFDLLLGFPVEASYNSFMRNEWLNPFNLQWYVRMSHPFRSLLTKPDQSLRSALGTRSSCDFTADTRTTYVEQTQQFDAYRFGYETGEFYRWNTSQGGGDAYAELKFQTRKRIIKELVIGKFLVTQHDALFIEQSMHQLVKDIEANAHFTMISMAVNPQDALLTAALEKSGFKPIDRKIYFIAKGPYAQEIKAWSDWWMFRSDIDTW